MTYVPLDLPPTLPISVVSSIRGGLEPFFHDVHYLLATTIGQPGDTAPRRQLQVPAAITLLSVIAGFSTKFCNRPGNTRERFENCLTDFFPWDIDPPTGVSKEEAAKVLYIVFRNPLVHYLGWNRSGHYVVKIGQTFRGTDDAERRVEELERITGKPQSDPCLVVEPGTPGKRVLWIDPLYWGVRKMVERWARDAHEVTEAAKRFS
jgi:hypothetical protein